MNQPRRRFLQSALAVPSAAWLLRWSSQPATAAPDDAEPLYKISLAEYSMHRMLAAGKLDHLDFAQLTKEEFGIGAVEYWNRPWFEKAEDKEYLEEMKRRAEDAGVRSLLIMVDGEGNLGDPDEAKRKEAVERHHKWVEAAQYLGCHSIRVNARSRGTYEEQLELAADGLARLSEFAKDYHLNVIVENHGGLSSNGKWLASVMKTVDMENCGTLPDFGNFGDYDRYQGVRELMPWAKAVSAKAHKFEEGGNAAHTDYERMMQIVVEAGYHGYVGIEWTGKEPAEIEGIRLTQRLLERVRDKLSENNDNSENDEKSKDENASLGESNSKTHVTEKSDDLSGEKATPKEDFQPSPSDLPVEPKKKPAPKAPGGEKPHAADSIADAVLAEPCEPTGSSFTRQCRRPRLFRRFRRFRCR